MNINSHWHHFNVNWMWNRNLTTVLSSQFIKSELESRQKMLSLSILNSKLHKNSLVNRIKTLKPKNVLSLSNLNSEAHERSLFFRFRTRYSKKVAQFSNSNSRVNRRCLVHRFWTRKSTKGDLSSPNSEIAKKVFSISIPKLTFNHSCFLSTSNSEVDKKWSVDRFLIQKSTKRAQFTDFELQRQLIRTQKVLS